MRSMKVLQLQLCIDPKIIFTMSIKLPFSPKAITLAIATALCSIMATTGSANAQYYDDYNSNNGYYDDRYDNGDYQMFYDDLAPHGTWMQDPTYGYVWAPRVGRDFRPYFTNGQWAMTNMGNMWVSGYSWGSIPFHYGRWVFNDFYGWLWIPGRVWAPSWVVWRQHSSYYGWAPMGPSVSINFNFGNYYTNHYDYWNFVPCGNLYGGNYGRYRRAHINNTFFNQTTIINNYHSHNSNRFFAGPRAADVRRVTGRDVRTYTVNHNNSRGRNAIRGNNIRVHAPTVGTTRRAVAPRNVKRIEESRKSRVDGNVARNHRSNVRSGSDNRVSQPRNTTPRNNNRSQVRDNDTRRQSPRNQGVQRRSQQTTPRVNSTPNNNSRTIQQRSPNRTQERNVTPQRQNTRNNQSRSIQREQPRTQQRSVAPQRQNTRNNQSRNIQRNQSRTQQRSVSPQRQSSPSRNIQQRNNTRRSEVSSPRSNQRTESRSTDRGSRNSNRR